VFPHRLTGTVADYEAVADNQRWNSGTVYKDRFDVSKLEQWNRIFSYLQAKGLYLHFKTQETENDQRMDGGNVGTERKLYYRELIARFGCHLALNWNLGEENSQTEQQRKDMARYFYDQDPYRHNVVLHTFPGDKNAVYTPLLGENSKLTGLSLQSSPGSIFSDTLMWVSNSAAAGKPWVVANDEQGSATIGIQCDSLDPEHDGVRRDVIWGHFMAGGAGVESYFGYATCGTSGKGAASDLSLEDFRTRDLWWDQCRFALGFFNENRVPFWEMQNRDALLSGVSGAHCLAQTGVGYVAYLPASGVASLDLTGVPGDFTVAWFDPFLGGGLQNGSVTQVAGGGVVSLGAPPAYSHKDWVALVRAVVPPQFLGIALQGQNTVITWTNSGFKLQSADEVAGTYVTLPAATSPYTNAPADADKYFRLIHAP
jgi:hypothetical protein